MVSAQLLIEEIQNLLEDAKKELDNVRKYQKEALSKALAGDFDCAVTAVTTAANGLRIAKDNEAEAAKLLVYLILQMKAEGFSDTDIYVVVETLIADILGA